VVKASQLYPTPVQLHYVTPFPVVDSTVIYETERGSAGPWEASSESHDYQLQSLLKLTLGSGATALGSLKQSQPIKLTHNAKKGV
jgi:hypothetical protein